MAARRDILRGFIVECTRTKRSTINFQYTFLSLHTLRQYFTNFQILTPFNSYDVRRENVLLFHSKYSFDSYCFQVRCNNVCECHFQLITYERGKKVRRIWVNRQRVKKNHSCECDITKQCKEIQVDERGSITTHLSDEFDVFIVYMYVWIGCITEIVWCQFNMPFA